MWQKQPGESTQDKLMSDLVNVKFVVLVRQSGSILPHQRREGKPKQLLLSFVLRCKNTNLDSSLKQADNSFLSFPQTMDKSQKSFWLFGLKLMMTSCGLTGTVSELKAEVRPSETVDGDGKFDELAPSGTVVVVEHKGSVLRHGGLP